jgi:hypothetical protein
MSISDLRHEAKRREITDREAVAWFVENGEEVMLYEEWLREPDEDGKVYLKPDEDAVYGEYDYHTNTPGALSWRTSNGEKQFAEKWPESEQRRDLLAAKAQQQAQQAAAPERKGALSRQVEPSHDRPCWVLKSLGMTKGSAERMGGFKVILEEYECVSGQWRRTKTPQERPTSLYQALEKADWWGRLPNMGRKRRAFNDANLNSAVPLFAAGLSQREVARRLKLGRGTVAALYRVWQASKVA